MSGLCCVCVCSVRSGDGREDGARRSFAAAAARGVVVAAAAAALLLFAVVAPPPRRSTSASSPPATARYVHYIRHYPLSLSPNLLVLVG